MTFLYIGLGIVMISGISLMMQIGNNINNINKTSITSNFKKDEYLQSNFKDNDQEILKILLNLPGSDFDNSEDICNEVIEKLTFDLYEPGEPYLKKENLDDLNDFFDESCTLRNGAHRVLIKKNETDNFNLYSCHLNLKESEIYCPFEEKKIFKEE